MGAGFSATSRDSQGAQSAPMDSPPTTLSPPTKKQKTSHHDHAGLDTVPDSDGSTSKDDDSVDQDAVYVAIFEADNSNLPGYLESIREGQYQECNKAVLKFGDISIHNMSVTPFFEAVGKLPKLEAVVCQDLCNSNHFWLDHVTDLLSQRPTSLRTIQLRDCVFCGSHRHPDSDVDYFANVLEKHQSTSLVNFELYNCDLVGQFDGFELAFWRWIFFNYNKVLSALVTMSNLKTVTLHIDTVEFSDRNELSLDLLQKLCAMPTLEELKLFGFRLQEDDDGNRLIPIISSLAPVINNPKSRLRVLHLCFSILTDSEQAALVKLLAENESLEELQIFPSRLDDTEGWDIDDLFLRLVESLQQNKTLKRFKVIADDYIPKQITDKSGKAIVELLKNKNSVLESFEISGYGALDKANTYFSQEIQNDIHFYGETKRSGEEEPTTKKEIIITDMDKTNALESKENEVDEEDKKLPAKKKSTQGIAESGSSPTYSEDIDIDEELTRLEKRKKKLSLQAEVDALELSVNGGQQQATNGEDVDIDDEIAKLERKKKKLQLQAEVAALEAKLNQQEQQHAQAQISMGMMGAMGHPGLAMYQQQQSGNRLPQFPLTLVGQSQGVPYPPTNGNLGYWNGMGLGYGGGPGVGGSSQVGGLGFGGISQFGMPGMGGSSPSGGSGFGSDGRQLGARGFDSGHSGGPGAGGSSHGH